MFKHKLLKYSFFLLVAVVTLFSLLLFRLSYKPVEINFLKEEIYKNLNDYPILRDLKIENVKVKLNLFENKINLELGTLNYTDDSININQINAETLSLNLKAIGLLKGQYEVIGIDIKNGSLEFMGNYFFEKKKFGNFFNKDLLISSVKKIGLSNIKLTVSNVKKNEFVNAEIVNGIFEIDNKKIVLKNLDLNKIQYFSKDAKDIFTLNNIKLSKLNEFEYIGNIRNIQISNLKELLKKNYPIIENETLTFEGTSLRLDVNEFKFSMESTLNIKEQQINLDIYGKLKNDLIDELNLAGNFKKINIQKFLNKQTLIPYKIEKVDSSPINLGGNFQLKIKNNSINEVLFDVFHNSDQFYKYTLSTSNKKKLDFLMRNFFFKGKYYDEQLKILDSKFYFKEGDLSILGKIENIFDKKKQQLAFTLTNFEVKKLINLYKLNNIINFKIVDKLDLSSGKIKQAFMEIESYDSQLILKSLLTNITEMKLRTADNYDFYIDDIVVELQSAQLDINARNIDISKKGKNSIIMKDTELFMNNFSIKDFIKKDYTIKTNFESDYKNLVKFLEINRGLNVEAYNIGRLQGFIKGNIKLFATYNKNTGKISLDYMLDGNLENFYSIEDEKNVPIPFSLEKFNGRVKAVDNILTIQGNGILNKSKTQLYIEIDDKKKMIANLKSFAEHSSFDFLGDFNYLEDGKTYLEIEINKTHIKNKLWTAKVKGNLYNNKTKIKHIDYVKDKNKKGYLNALLYFRNFALTKIERLEFFTEDIIINADLEFNKASKLEKIRINEYLTNTENFKGTISNFKHKYAKINIQGKKFNLDNYLNKKSKSKINLDINIDIENLYLSKRNLGQTKLTSKIINSKINTMSGHIFFNEEKYVSFQTSDMEQNTINIEFKNLGQFLKNIGLTDNIDGGKGEIVLSVDKIEKQIINGICNVEDYNIKKASYLARLLQLASFTGLVEILGVEGIPFNLLKGSFKINNGNIYLENTRLEGVSLGVSVEGNVSIKNKTLNLEGVLIPAYAINAIINKIPLVGEVFTGTKGEGIIGVNYKAKGTFEKPDYSINPLSVFTPGILRNIFDIFDKKQEEQKSNQ